MNSELPTDQTSLFRIQWREEEGSPCAFLQTTTAVPPCCIAHQWAYGRNPAFYDYENVGGDCTNFASQCVFAGSGVMNFTPDFGWYYIDANQKSPSWTGVPYFWNFMTRQAPSVGPVAQPCALEDLQPGDLVQLSFNGQEFQHTPVVVRVTAPITLETVLIAAHSYDADNRPLSTYTFQDIRFLHVLGTIRP